jgi:hypothetical protein
LGVRGRDSHVGSRVGSIGASELDRAGQHRASATRQSLGLRLVSSAQPCDSGGNSVVARVPRGLGFGGQLMLGRKLFGLGELGVSRVETWSTVSYWRGVGWLLGRVRIVSLKVDVLLSSENIG